MKKTLANLKRNFMKRTADVRFKIDKKSPEILFVIGVGVGVLALIDTYRAGYKTKKVVDEALEQIDDIHDSSEPVAIESDDNNEPVDKCESTELSPASEKELKVVYAKLAWDCMKSAIIPLALFGTSMFCFSKSHHILTTRNLGLAAAYTGLMADLNHYKGAVKTYFGEDQVKEMEQEMSAEANAVVETNDDGNVVATKAITPGVYEDRTSRFFDSSCSGWTKDPEYNLRYLKHIENICTDMLRQNHRLPLNDAYEMLGIEPTTSGLVDGWKYDKNLPESENYVDFGLYNDDEATRRFINGLEPVVLLRFNITGNIYDDIL